MREGEREEEEEEEEEEEPSGIEKRNGYIGIGRAMMINKGR